ncbi:MAG: response regulator [Candidatus Kapaibacterium sp.]
MKTLVVEDDYITAEVMHEIMLSFGECDVAENGKIALDKFGQALDVDDPYDIIFLDIMMPEMDGQTVLGKIREMEHDKGIRGLEGVKIVMTTALDDFDNIKRAFKHQAEGYIIKPIDKDKVIKTLIDLELLV